MESVADYNEYVEPVLHDSHHENFPGNRDISSRNGPRHNFFPDQHNLGRTDDRYRDARRDEHGTWGVFHLRNH